MKELMIKIIFLFKQRNDNATMQGTLQNSLTFVFQDSEGITGPEQMYKDDLALSRTPTEIQAT